MQRPPHFLPIPLGPSTRLFPRPPHPQRSNPSHFKLLTKQSNHMSTSTSLCSLSLGHFPFTRSEWSAQLKLCPWGDFPPPLIFRATPEWVCGRAAVCFWLGLPHWAQSFKNPALSFSFSVSSSQRSPYVALGMSCGTDDGAMVGNDMEPGAAAWAAYFCPLPLFVLNPECITPILMLLDTLDLITLWVWQNTVHDRHFWIHRHLMSSGQAFCLFHGS